jgi:hypothetical protein
MALCQLDGVGLACSGESIACTPGLVGTVDIHHDDASDHADSRWLHERHWRVERGDSDHGHGSGS